jgi:hypothetical protein
MTAPNPIKQKKARAKLASVFADASNTWVIHYSCESFYGPNGASPRITSIAVRRLDSGQTLSFSIHQVAEQRRVAFDQIEAQYDDLERQMLEAFYAHVGGHRGMRYLHWNMRDINYGFAAIEHRFCVLNGNPIVIEDDKKIDLARLLWAYEEEVRVVKCIRSVKGANCETQSGVFSLIELPRGAGRLHAFHVPILGRALGSTSSRAAPRLAAPSKFAGARFNTRGSISGSTT